jgi:hypothetical protein
VRPEATSVCGLKLLRGVLLLKYPIEYGVGEAPHFEEEKERIWMCEK